MAQVVLGLELANGQTWHVLKPITKHKHKSTADSLDNMLK